MENEFTKLINDYADGTMEIDKIRLFLLSHTVDANYLEYVDKLISIAIGNGDKAAEAFFHATKFWKLYLTDLNAAKDENKKAIDLYCSIENHENAFGFLTTLNNNLVAATLEGDIDKAYDAVETGLRLSKQTNKNIYYIAFSDNYVYVLNEVGQYEKALEVIKDNLKLRYVMVKTNYYLAEYLYISELILLKRFDEALSYLSDVIMRKKDIIKDFDPRVFYAQYMRLYIAMGDEAKAREYYNMVVNLYDIEEDDWNEDIVDVYLDIARYYAFIKDYELAYTYYDYCHTNSHGLLGEKHSILLPLISLGEKLGKDVSALKDELKILDEKCAVTLEKILSNSGYLIEDDVTDLTQIEEDLKKINNLYHLREYMNTVLKPIFDAQYINMIFRNNSDGVYTLERRERTKVFLASEISRMDSFNGCPVRAVDLPFKTEEGCAAAYVFPLKKEECLGYLLIGYDDVNMYTYGVNKKTIEKLKEILSNRLDELYREFADRYTVNRDFLTNAQNRYAIVKFSGNVSARLEDFYVVALSVDKFEDIYKLSFNAGDGVLVDFAERLKKHFGDEYTFRYDAYTFMCLVMGDNELTEKILDNLYADVRSASFDCDGQKIPYTISAGGSYVSNIDCFMNSLSAAMEKCVNAAKEGDNYILYIEKDMQLKCQKYLKNIKEYMRIDNTSFMDLSDKEALLGSLREIYNRERQLMFEDNDLIKETYGKYASGEVPLPYSAWKVLREFTGDLSAISKNFDSSLAYLIRKLLFDFDKRKGLLDEAVEDIYYLGLLEWQIGEFLTDRVVTERLVEEYKPMFPKMSSEAKIHYLKAYGNVALIYNNNDINVMRMFVGRYIEFLEQAEKNYNLDYNFNVARLTVYRNASSGLSRLRDGYEATQENIDFVYQCAYNAVNLIDYAPKSPSLRKLIRYKFHAASYHKGLVSKHEFIKYLYKVSTPKPDDSDDEKVLTLLDMGVYYLIYAINLGFRESAEFNYRLKEVVDFALHIIKGNTSITLDLKILNLVQICAAHLEPDTSKELLMKITVHRHTSTVIHVMGVTEICNLILKYMLKRNPEYFVGVLGTKNAEEVDDEKGAIKRACNEMAMLHDIGKHKIMRIINNSSRRLFDFEFNALKKHTTFGYDLVKNTQFSDVVKDGIRFHHKWYNNQGGYPDEKDESPNKPLVDILSVADSIDAATDKYGRSYAYAKTLKDMVEEFNGFKDTRYSGAVVEALEQPEVFDQVNDFIENRRADLIYNIYRAYNGRN